MNQKRGFIFFSLVIVFIAVLISSLVFAGNLYIKPNLERKRAERLLEEAEKEFSNAKVHITLSPEISIHEFELSRSKIKQAVELIEKYGEGYYSPGDVDDFNSRMKESEMWIEKCKKAIEEKTAEKALQAK